MKVLCFLLTKILPNYFPLHNHVQIVTSAHNQAKILVSAKTTATEIETQTIAEHQTLCPRGGAHAHIMQVLQRQGDLCYVHSGLLLGERAGTVEMHEQLSATHIV